MSFEDYAKAQRRAHLLRDLASKLREALHHELGSLEIVGNRLEASMARKAVIKNVLRRMELPLT